MDEVTFSNVAPVLSVLDLDRALRRYRKLGFSVRRYEGPDRYGFVARDGVELHLSESPEHDRRRDGSEIYLYVSDADALYAAWSAAGVKGRFVEPTTRPTVSGSSPSWTATARRIGWGLLWCTTSSCGPLSAGLSGQP
jgi:Glyoxalase/Bleomycin resistance protein/Dioxygenase superfamily